MSPQPKKKPATKRKPAAKKPAAPKPVEEPKIETAPEPEPQAESAPAPEPIPASSLTVDQHVVDDPRRQPTPGTFVEVEDSTGRLRYGGYIQTLTTRLTEDGRTVPDEILVRTRDSDHEDLSVKWADCTVVPSRGRS